MNLAINARDDTPNGGRLTIEPMNRRLGPTYFNDNADASPGEYVVLSVTDDGVGMPEHIRDKVVEPFFTTKDVGKASGVGLFMVYGYAQKTGGHLKIYSEVGKGPTVNLDLSRNQDAKCHHPESEEDISILMGDGEQILVLKVDGRVHEMVVHMLKELGDEVLEAEHPEEALAMIDSHDDIALIFSDVVVHRGISGSEFADSVSAERNDLKLIFMSGCTSVVATRNGYLSADKVLLHKPFQYRELAVAVRRAIDG